MRILMTNHALHQIGGTETWTQTVAHELVNRGQDVEIATFIPGTMSGFMPCAVRPFTSFSGSEVYDLILVNHNTCLGMVQGIGGFKILTCHGPTHQLEAPARGADRYVCVSEEIRGCREFPTPPTVIRQPINTRQFRPQPRLGKDADVLVMTKNARAAHLAVAACRQAGLTTNLAHYTMAPCLDVSTMIPLHRAVITSGRGILEALACGIPAFSLNHREGKFFGDGWITEDILPLASKFNYSGRALDRPYDQDTLAKEIGALPADLPGGLSPASWGPAWIAARHDVRDIVDLYMALMEIDPEAKAVLSEEVAA